MGDRDRDDDRIWRAAFREGYRRNPRAGELANYQFWHGIDRRHSFARSWLRPDQIAELVALAGDPGPWQCWPAKRILDAAQSALDRMSREAAQAASDTACSHCEQASPETICSDSEQIPETVGKVFTVSAADTAPEPRRHGRRSAWADRCPARCALMRTGEIRILPCRRLAAAGPPKVQQAQALLQAQLADGPKSGAQVEAAALEASIPERVLIAAADSLGVRTQRGQWWLP